jgi:hypothetical protein
MTCLPNDAIFTAQFVNSRDHGKFLGFLLVDDTMFDSSLQDWRKGSHEDIKTVLTFANNQRNGRWSSWRTYVIIAMKENRQRQFNHAITTSRRQETCIIT